MDAGTARGDVQFVGVNSAAVQEITVITGGMEAEYGNATSGVIHIITREGGKIFSRQKPPHLYSTRQKTLGGQCL